MFGSSRVLNRPGCLRVRDPDRLVRNGRVFFYKKYLVYNVNYFMFVSEF